MKIEDLFVGQKFRYDHLCMDNDFYISEICPISDTVTLKTIRHPSKTSLAHPFYDKFGFGYKIVKIQDFLDDCNKNSWNKPIPYNGNNRY
jgi:hypothetical protein